MAKPAFKTVANVELVKVGVEYDLSTGPTTFTPEDLADAVQAANEDPSIPSPRLKIGHTDPRYNDTTVFDGSPSWGSARNLRLSENGMSIIGDYVGVPAWLADILPYCFPSRSIEGYKGVQSKMGKTYRFILSANSLLGVVWPGVTVLEDLPMYLTEEVPSDVVIDAEIVAAVAASKQPGGDPMPKPIAASANLDDVRRAFYNEYVPTHQTEGTLWWWICAVYTDPNEIVVEDDETGQLYRLPFSSDAEGNVEFGEAEAVRLQYIPDTRESRKAAAKHIAAALGVGREALAVYPDRAASRPDTRTGGAMDPKVIRQRLGLPEGATDEQVRQSLLELNRGVGIIVDESGGGNEGTEGGEGTTMPPPTTEPAQPQPQEQPTTPAQPAQPTTPAQPEEPASVAASGDKVPPGMVLVDAGTLETLKTGAQTALEIRKEQNETVRENAVSAAIADGRIPPAREKHWLEYLERDMEGGLQILAGMEKGLVPVEQRSHGHVREEFAGASSPEQEQVTQWTRQLFPETRAIDAEAAAIAAGQPVRRPRVMADAAYRR